MVKFGWSERVGLDLRPSFVGVEGTAEEGKGVKGTVGEGAGSGLGWGWLGVGF